MLVPPLAHPRISLTRTSTSPSTTGAALSLVSALRAAPARRPSPLHCRAFRPRSLRVPRATAPERPAPSSAWRCASRGALCPSPPRPRPLAARRPPRWRLARALASVATARAPPPSRGPRSRPLPPPPPASPAPSPAAPTRGPAMGAVETTGGREPAVPLADIERGGRSTGRRTDLRHPDRWTRPSVPCPRHVPVPGAQYTTPERAVSPFDRCTTAPHTQPSRGG